MYSKLFYYIVKKIANFMFKDTKILGLIRWYFIFDNNFLEWSCETFITIGIKVISILWDEQQLFFVEQVQ